jgi:hypothetical protein
MYRCRTFPSGSNVLHAEEFGKNNSMPLETPILHTFAIQLSLLDFMIFKEKKEKSAYENLSPKQKSTLYNTSFVLSIFFQAENESLVISR